MSIKLTDYQMYILERIKEANASDYGYSKMFRCPVADYLVKVGLARTESGGGYWLTKEGKKFLDNYISPFLLVIIGAMVGMMVAYLLIEVTVLG